MCVSHTGPLNGSATLNPYTFKRAKEPVDYNGERNAKGVVDFATSQIPNLVTHVGKDRALLTDSCKGDGAIYRQGLVIVYITYEACFSIRCLDASFRSLFRYYQSPTILSPRPIPASLGP